MSERRVSPDLFRGCVSYLTHTASQTSGDHDDSAYARNTGGLLITRPSAGVGKGAAVCAQYLGRESARPGRANEIDDSVMAITSAEAV
jgi:hypothetical protein